MVADGYRFAVLDNVRAFFKTCVAARDRTWSWQQSGRSHRRAGAGWTPRWSNRNSKSRRRKWEALMLIHPLNEFWPAHSCCHNPPPLLESYGTTISTSDRVPTFPLPMSPNVLVECFRMGFSKLTSLIFILTTALIFEVLILGPYFNGRYPFSWVYNYDLGDNCFQSDFLFKLEQCGCPRIIQRTSCR